VRLTGTPQAISIGDMLMSEGGPETIHTTNRMYRLLVGLQGRLESLLGPGKRAR
jgi:hypothetical protein